MGISSLNEVHHLYKYRYFDNNNFHIKTIIDNEFYFASIEELNDPFDLTLRPKYEDGTEEQMIKYAFNEVDKMNKTENEKITLKRISSENIKKDSKNLKNEMILKFKEIIAKSRVCSFSANKWNDILMWSHYSNANTGFCIGINWNKFSQFLWDNHRYLINPWIVEYGKNYPELNPFLDNESKESYKKAVTYKYDVWSYENEIRLIMMNTSLKILNIPDFLFDEIYLGLNCSKENIELIKNALKIKNNNIKLYQIYQKNNNFEFSRLEIVY